MGHAPRCQIDPVSTVPAAMIKIPLNSTENSRKYGGENQNYIIRFELQIAVLINLDIHSFRYRHINIIF